MFKKIMSVIMLLCVASWGFPLVTLEDSRYQLITVASESVPKTIESSGFKIKTEITKEVPETVVLPITDIDDDSMTALAIQMQVYHTIGVKNFVLWFDSDGGIVRSGVAFTNFILKFPAPTLCIVNSHASSMAFYILQGCSARMAKKDSRLMTHEPGVLLISPTGAPYIPMTYSALRAKTKELEEMNLILAEFIVARSRVPKQVFLDKIAEGDWVMNTEQALEFGFLDGVYEGPDLEPTNAIVPTTK